MTEGLEREWGLLAREQGLPEIRRRPGDPHGPGGEAAKTAGIPAEWGKFCADELAAS